VAALEQGAWEAPGATTQTASMYPDARLIPKWCRFLRTHYRNFETSKSWRCPKGQKPEARTRFTPHGPTGCNGATSKAILLQICEPLAEALGDGESEGAGFGENEKRNLVHDTSSCNTVGRCIAHLQGLLPMRRVCSREKDRSCEGTERTLEQKNTGLGDTDEIAH